MSTMNNIVISIFHLHYDKERYRNNSLFFYFCISHLRINSNRCISGVTCTVLPSLLHSNRHTSTLIKLRGKEGGRREKGDVSTTSTTSTTSTPPPISSLSPSPPQTQSPLKSLATKQSPRKKERKCG